MKQLIAVIALSVCFGAFADSVANRPSDLADTFSLNADWRFTKAPVTIPLAQAKASVETKGVKVEDPAFDDSAWEIVSVPHPINARDSFDNHAVDAGESSFWRGMAFYRKRFSLPEGTGNPPSPRLRRTSGERGMGKATNITVPTNKVCLASRLTFSSIRTVLPILV